MNTSLYCTVHIHGIVQNVRWSLICPQKNSQKKPYLRNPLHSFQKNIQFFYVKKYRSLHIVPRTTIWYEASMDTLAQVSVGGLAQVAVRR